MKKSIFILIDWFDPAYKAGGPIRSCINFVNYLGKDYDIHVFTSNHDLDKNDTFTALTYDTWLPYNETAKVFYASPQSLGLKFLAGELKRIDPDFIYINSVFSVNFAIYPLLIKRFGNIRAKVVLSPRGMLRPSALRMKSQKKKLFLHVFKMLGLDKSIHFHATDINEANDIKRYFRNASIGITPNLPQISQRRPMPVKKEAGEILLIFVGRVHPIKNLHFLLELLNNVSGKVTLNVLGVIEDKEYLGVCEAIVSTFSSDKQVIFKGDLPHDEIQQLLFMHHLFVLPTLGENFGHAIFEALAAGRPVLISNQTPWVNLRDEYAGWDLDLAKKDTFTRVLNEAVDMNQVEYDRWSAGAFNYITKFLSSSDFLSVYKSLFR